MSIRITGGSLGGRFISSPEGRQTRPTSSLTRQALCNILGERIPSARVLDLYAGSGVISCEWISRGALEAVLVEQAPVVAKLIRRNMESLGVTKQARIVQGDVLRLLQNPQTLASFDLIYADPPFVSTYPDLRPALALLNPEGMAIFEMPSRRLPDWSREAMDLRRYGESSLAFFQPKLG
ncbi:MAG TPA: RsmD family RNA methyltransferase [Fibrobacteraceae bacterium]|nr:RsmD family RNA methyltransferase [Fibrobacteraceae bacterium]